jgi:hypothetical protein
MRGRKGIRSEAGSHGGGERRQPCGTPSVRLSAVAASMWRRLSGGAAVGVFACVCGRGERKSVKMTTGQKIFGLGVSGLNDMPSDGIGLEQV